MGIGNIKSMAIQIDTVRPVHGILLCRGGRIGRGIGINLIDQHGEHIRLAKDNIRAIGRPRHIRRNAIED